MVTFEKTQTNEGLEPRKHTSTMDQKVGFPGFRRRRVESVERSNFDYVSETPNEPRVRVSVETVEEGEDVNEFCSANITVFDEEGAPIFSYYESPYGEDDFTTFEEPVNGRIEPMLGLERRDLSTVAARRFSSAKIEGDRFDASKIRAAIEGSNIPHKDQVLIAFDKGVDTIVSHRFYVDECLTYAVRDLNPQDKMRDASKARDLCLEVLDLQPDNPIAHFHVARAEYAQGPVARDDSFVLDHLREAGRLDLNYIREGRSIRLDLLGSREAVYRDEKDIIFGALREADSRETKRDLHLHLAKEEYALEEEADPEFVLGQLRAAGEIDPTVIQRFEEIRVGLVGKVRAAEEEKAAAVNALLVNPDSALARYLLEASKVKVVDAKTEEGEPTELSDSDRRSALYNLRQAAVMDPLFFNYGKGLRKRLTEGDEDTLALAERDLAKRVLEANPDSGKSHLYAAKTEFEVTGTANAGSIRTTCRRAVELDASYGPYAAELIEDLEALELDERKKADEKYPLLIQRLSVGDVERAMTILDGSFEEYDTTAERNIVTLYEEANAAIASEDFEKGRDIAERLIQLDDSLAEAHYLFALGLSKTERGRDNPSWVGWECFRAEELGGDEYKGKTTPIRDTVGQH